jgi:hypothetical protein
MACVGASPVPGSDETHHHGYGKGRDAQSRTHMLPASLLMGNERCVTNVRPLGLLLSGLTFIRTAAPQ